MIAFPDTSFLCAFYRQQDNSKTAEAYFKSMAEPLHVSSLLLYEFRQGLRFQVWLHSRDKTKGYGRAECDRALADLQSDLNDDVLRIVPADWAEVHRLADAIAVRHTMAHGHRSFDVLHVATALHLGAEEMLTFDGNQRRLALAEKLKVQP